MLGCTFENQPWSWHIGPSEVFLQEKKTKYAARQVENKNEDLFLDSQLFYSCASVQTDAQLFIFK